MRSHHPTSISIEASPDEPDTCPVRALFSYLGTDHLIWRGRGGGYVFFLKIYSDSQCCWKKYSDCGRGKKK
jgi:hypothetical protein